MALFQGLRWSSRCIDHGPVNRADIIFLLNFGDFRRRVGSVTFTAADAAQSDRKVGDEKQPHKPDIQLARRVADRGSFRFKREHRVDHDGMTLDKNAGRTLHQDFVDPCGNLRLVCTRRQPVRFIELKLLLSQRLASRLLPRCAVRQWD